MMNDVIRTVRLTPYRRGSGPRFTLTLSDTGRTDWRGCSVLAYRLTQHGADGTGFGRASVVIFEGSDFCGSPLNADDSDRTVAALLGFLTLRPGDTDREYFAAYTEAQHAFTQAHAEALSAEASYRFGEDN